MLFTRFPRVVSGQTTVTEPGCDTTATWLPSITFSPVKEPMMESKGRAETVPVTNDSPPSVDEARTSAASTSSGSSLRS